jgi:iron complex outermembrane receptor protein
MRTPPVPAYTAVDVRYGLKIARDVEAGLVIRNLTDSRHAEWRHSGMLVEHERSALVQVSWRL